MKNFIYLLSLLFSINSYGSTRCRKYDVIAQINDYIKVSDVVRTDTTTSIRLTYSMEPGDSFRIPQTLYLSDEEGVRYRMLGAKDVQPGEYVQCSLSGDVSIVLQFEPMPKQVKIFDLCGSVGLYSSFGFWGIHESKVKAKKIFTYRDTYVLRDKSLLNPGKITIVGEILNYNKESYPDKIAVSHQNIIGSGERTKRSEGTKITSEGRFTISTSLMGHAWTYIELGDKYRIPVYLTPNDTLFVTMNLEDGVNRSVEYQSAHGHDLMQGLMKADPMYQDWSISNWRGKKVRPDDLAQEIKTRKEYIEKLCGYLSWKYKLSPKEVHLIYLKAMYELVDASIYRINKNIKDIYDLKYLFRMNESAVRDIVFSKEVLDSYFFLKEINTTDYSYFIIPAHNNLRGLTAPYFVNTSLLGDEDSSLNTLERYLGQPLDDEWRKRLLFR